MPETATPARDGSWRSRPPCVFRRDPARDVGGVLRLADGETAAVKVEHHRARGAPRARRRWTEDLAADAASRRRNGDLAHVDIGVEFGGAFPQLRCGGGLLPPHLPDSALMPHHSTPTP